MSADDAEKPVEASGAARSPKPSAPRPWRSSSAPDLLDQVAPTSTPWATSARRRTSACCTWWPSPASSLDPLSAIVLSQSGAGKSGITEVIEKLTPPEDVVLLTRLTPQSLYYVEPGFLDQKLVIIEERYGSMEADYSIRVLQSRKKLIAAAPIKDPADRQHEDQDLHRRGPRRLHRGHHRQRASTTRTPPAASS